MSNINLKYLLTMSSNDSLLVEEGDLRLSLEIADQEVTL